MKKYPILAGRFISNVKNIYLNYQSESSKSSAFSQLFSIQNTCIFLSFNMGYFKSSADICVIEMS